MSCVSYPTSVEVGGTRAVGPPKNVGGTPLLGVGLSVVGFSNIGVVPVDAGHSPSYPLVKPANSTAPTSAGQNFHSSRGWVKTKTTKKQCHVQTFKILT